MAESGNIAVMGNAREARKDANLGQVPALSVNYGTVTSGHGGIGDKPGLQEETHEALSINFNRNNLQAR